MSCPGHPGHIELPVHIYNVTVFDQLLRLLKAQCIYCHRFRLSRRDINGYVCKLRLLQYGLVEEAGVVGEMGLQKGKGKGNNKAGSDEDDEDEDDEDLIARRNAYVRKCIAKVPAQVKAQQYHLQGQKSPVAAEQRRELIREFLKEVSAAKKCAACQGYVVFQWSPCWRAPSDGSQYLPIISQGQVLKGFPESLDAKSASRHGSGRVPDPQSSCPYGRCEASI